MFPPALIGGHKDRQLGGWAPLYADVMEMVTQDELDIIAAAQRAVSTHGDGDVHTVAAAVLDEWGVIHVGLNLHHFNGGPCAELTALAVARGAGARDPQLIVAVGDQGRGVLSPCGRDRQVFADYYPSIRVVVPTPEGLRILSASELLPFGYIRHS